MVQAIVSISKEANQVLEIVKAKYGLKNKSEAINVVVKEYEQDLLEPELRPDYIEKLERILKSEKVRDVEDFEKEFGLR